MSWGGPVRYAAAVAVVAAAAAAGGDLPSSVGGEAVRAAAGYRLAADQDVRPTTRAVLRTHDWAGGAQTLATGETVRVYVSRAFPDANAAARRWAEYLGGLVHGTELVRLEAYFAPLDEVVELCGGDALGCYGNNTLVSVGEPTDGIRAEEVAAHEYGHHVASNRLNPPWNATAWGTKRWASYANVCARTAAGTAFPGDQGARYELNPGEAFAEAYRVLTERRRGSQTFTWPLVDASFAPDERALAVLERDVREPWLQTRSRTVVVASRAKAWRLPLKTLLDGSLEATVTAAPSTSFDLALLSGTRTLARGLWSGVRSQRITYTICGERGLALRVVRRGRASRASMRILVP